VSCTSPSACVAVGDSNIDPTQVVPHALAERWDGSSWSLQATPNAPDASSELDGVSCTDSRACTAVGDTYGGPGTGQPLVERWDGTSWSLERTPNAPGNFLSAVSCTSSTICTAVGGVHAERSAPASAELSDIPSPCAGGRLTLHVTGLGISSVTWRLGTRRITGRTIVPGTRYAVRIRLSPGRHSLSVKVKFEASAQTPAHTFRRIVAGCPIPR
jgi:hypothetical protein